jgi:hypothetical protein
VSFGWVLATGGPGGCQSGSKGGSNGRKRSEGPAPKSTPRTKKSPQHGRRKAALSISFTAANRRLRSRCPVARRSLRAGCIGMPGAHPRSNRRALAFLNRS